jgi:murein DD-endopeptidase MepM/ murein hydrolase activator NlpD
VRVSRFILLLVVALAVAAASASYFVRHHEEKQTVAQAPAAPVVVEAPKEETIRLVVDRGASLGPLLLHAGVDGTTMQQMIEAARPLMNFRRLREGQELFLVRSGAGEVESLRYKPDRAEELHIDRQGGGFTAKLEQIPQTTNIVTVTGKVQDSLFDAVIAAGESPALAVRLADIFAWNLDFYTDTRPGDTFRLVVEKKKYDGEKSAEYGQIFAAEYDNAGHPYQAVLFHDHAGRPGYYAADGRSLQKAFLRSPLRFAARISSHYSVHRFHPILKRYMAHLGTDYAAPVGTPVQAVANGTVEFAGQLGGDGKMVRLRHANGYETYYLHLSRLKVRKGQKVDQGQLVGLVGATGLATGPHLDFRVRRAGQFINFERMNLPPAQAVARADRQDFDAVRDKWFGEMTGSRSDLAQAAPATTDANHAGTP